MIWTPYHILKKNNKDNENFGRELKEMLTKGFIIRRWSYEKNEYEYARVFATSIKYKNFIM